MRSKETSRLVQGSRWAGHDERHSQHSVWEPFDLKGDDKKGHLPRGIILSICVRKSQK